MASELSAEWFWQPSLQLGPPVLAFLDMQWTGLTVLSHLGARKKLVSCHQKVRYLIQTPGLSWVFMEWRQIVVSRGLLAKSGLCNEWDESGGASLLLLTGGVWGTNLGMRLYTETRQFSSDGEKSKKVHGHQVCSNRIRSQMQMQWKDPTGLWTRVCPSHKLSVGRGEQCAEKYKSKHPHG